MGNGIAQVFAQSGLDVRLCDSAGPALDRARANIEKSLGEVRREGQADRAAIATSRIARVSTTGTPRAAGGRRLRGRGDRGGRGRQASSCSRKLDAITRPGRHPGVEHLVDLDHGARRGDQAARQGPRHALHEPGAADDAGRADSRPGDVGRVDDDRRPSSACALGKTAVEAADYPGFIANRILMPMINEAIYALMEGVGTRRGDRHAS